jgi:hypothetical protein
VAARLLILIVLGTGGLAGRGWISHEASHLTSSVSHDARKAVACPAQAWAAGYQRVEASLVVALRRGKDAASPQRSVRAAFTHAVAGRLAGVHAYLVRHRLPSICLAKEPYAAALRDSATAIQSWRRVEPKILTSVQVNVSGWQRTWVAQMKLFGRDSGALVSQLHAVYAAARAIAP